MSRKEMFIFITFWTLVFGVSIKIGAIILDIHFPKKDDKEFVVNKTHQVGELTDKGWKPNVYFLETNKTTYIVNSGVYYGTNIGDEYYD